MRFKYVRRQIPGITSFTLLAIGALSVAPAAECQEAAPLSEQASTFVGASECTLCHRRDHKRWDESRHSKMVRPANPDGVIGDFSVRSVKLRGKRYDLSVRDGVYTITESYLTGKKTKRRIDYTLGNRRIQHYLTTLEDGRIVVLPPSWDATRTEWFHNMEIVGMPNPDQGLPVQVWNKNCFGCHVSQQQKQFDPEDKTYVNDWIDFGTNCERCHGPASRHVERYTKRSAYKDDPNRYIVMQTDLDPARNTMVCAQCHSFRDVVAPGYTAGEDYFDYFLPLLEYSQEESDDPVWYPDGRTRRFSTNALAFWQSECFLKGGAACTNCHIDPHVPEIELNPQLQPTNNGLCTGCHAEIGDQLSAHTRHEAVSTGSSCVECHMPRSVVSIKATMRDHTLSIPTPENTIRYAVPNACTLCHEDQTPEWAVETLNSWYPESTARQKFIDRAAIFTGARRADPAILPRLLVLADNKDEPPLARANAVGYLDRYASDPRVVPALMRAAADDHPMVRAIAALKMGQIENVAVARVRPTLVDALGDESRIVRMNASMSLLNLGVRRLEGEAGRRFEKAKQDHITRASYYPDDAAAQLNLGKFYVLNRDADGAALAFGASQQIDAEQQGIEYFLALARVGQHRFDEAKELLKKVGRNDPYSRQAKALLEKLKN